MAVESIAVGVNELVGMDEIVVIYYISIIIMWPKFEKEQLKKN